MLAFLKSFSVNAENYKTEILARDLQIKIIFLRIL